MKIINTMLAAATLFATAAMAGSPVNVNTASAEQLAESLDGVGPSKAEAIVEYREEHGPFKTADELVAVKGIGIATVDKNEEFIRLED